MMSGLIGQRKPRPRLGLKDRRSSADRPNLAVIAGLLIIGTAGCANVSVRNAWLRNVIDEREDRFEATHRLSDATRAVLTNHGLFDKAANDPGGAARILETSLRADSEPDAALALAELSYQAGLLLQSASPRSAMAWYRDAAAFAWLALANPASSRRDLAARIHNGAVGRLIRASQDEDGRGNRDWRQFLGAEGIALQGAVPYLDPLQITDLRVAADLRVKGIDHVYRTGGLGVPLVAHRAVVGQTPSPQSQVRVLPNVLTTGATAVLMAGGSLLGGDWRSKPVTLVLFDAFEPRSLAIGGNEVDLAHDRTTPLAVVTANRSLAGAEWTGLIRSDFDQQGVETGLYMIRPYEPGKIPVVFVHGLISTPSVWVQTINELRNTPSIAARYQFWVFLYPTGLPIPASARQLRQSLTQARDAVDPGHDDGAFDQMVLVGHSMGGLLAKMMAQDTGFKLWDAAITVPHDRFQATPELRKNLDNLLIFQPLPFVRRVVFVAAPHRGSPVADGAVGWVVERLVRGTHEQMAHLAEIEALNGPNVISPELKGPALNAIGNLRTDSPILAALDRIPIDPAVPYHSIIPMIGGVAGTDGVVEYRSSHLDGAAAERIVSGTHFSQEAPEVRRELRRILLEHLAAVESTNAPSERR